MAEWKPSQGRRPQSAHLRPVPLGATGGTHRPTNLPVYGGEGSGPLRVPDAGYNHPALR